MPQYAFLSNVSSTIRSEYIYEDTQLVNIHGHSKAALAILHTYIASYQCQFLNVNLTVYIDVKQKAVSKLVVAEA